MCEGLFFCWILSVDLYILLFNDNCIYLLVEQTHSSINSNNTFYFFFFFFFTCIGIPIYVGYFVCDSASEFGAMGSTSFLGVFLP